MILSPGLYHAMIRVPMALDARRPRPRPGPVSAPNATGRVVLTWSLKANLQVFIKTKTNVNSPLSESFSPYFPSHLLVFVPPLENGLRCRAGKWHSTPEFRDHQHRTTDTQLAPLSPTERRGLASPGSSVTFPAPALLAAAARGTGCGPVDFVK